MAKHKAKILFFDIENAPNVSYTWAKWGQDVLKFEEEWYMLSFAYKWYGNKLVRVKGLPDYKLYKTQPRNDKKLVKDLWELFDEAQVLVAHNADRFDVRKANARFAHHGLEPPSPFRTVDTLKIARKHFMLNSNKLNDIGEYLGLGGKRKHDGIETWIGCMKGDEKAWETMLEYNKRDVELLEKVYLKLRIWGDNYPNMNIVNDTTDNCPMCGEDSLIKKGYRQTKVGKYQRYKCTECGKWSKGEKINQRVIPR